MSEQHYRILVIDDNPAIHDDLRKILIDASESHAAVQDAEALLFDEPANPVSHCRFEIDSAFQGQEGLAMVQKALAEGRPYALAFIDIRMPPGWDGVETIQRVWPVCPDLQVVICTAYSDYSWRDIVKTLGRSDSLVILKKPFDSIEVLQLAHALTTKWQLGAQARCRLDDLDRRVNQRTEELRATNEQLRREICERQLAEEGMRASEERFAKAFSISPVPMVIQDEAEERLVDVNQSFLKMTGFSREEVLQRTFAELRIWSSPDAPSPVRDLLAQGQPVHQLPCRIRVKTGETREAVLFAESFNLGLRPHVLLLLEDVTARKDLDEQLRQAYKMEAVGQLAAGVAHDFNNILTIIQGHVSLLLDRTKHEADMNQPLRHVLGASERASLLTRQLLAFSRKQMIQRRPLRLEALLEQHHPMLRRLLGEHVQLDTRCAPDLPAIHADACNLEQVIMNLAVNSRDAMPHGGQLTIRAEPVRIGPAYVAAHPEAAAGDFVCLSVSDTGCGMDAATQARLFEPFFTTKEVGKGTGMGLASVYGIVKQHNGWIEVNSTVGQGSEFKVFLPVCSTEAVEPPRAALSHTSRILRPQHETILVVEDEPFLREFIETVLRNCGYRILVAGDANEALRVWDEQRGRIDLLLTDMVMPGGMSGHQLVKELSRRTPDLKAIYTSGYSRDVLGSELKWDDERVFLQKPYQSQVLVRTVRECLAETSRPRGMVNSGWAALN